MTIEISPHTCIDVGELPLAWACPACWVSQVNRLWVAHNSSCCKFRDRCCRQNGTVQCWKTLRFAVWLVIGIGYRFRFRLSVLDLFRYTYKRTKRFKTKRNRIEEEKPKNICWSIWAHVEEVQCLYIWFDYGFLWFYFFFTSIVQKLFSLLFLFVWEEAQ